MFSKYIYNNLEVHGQFRSCFTSKNTLGLYASSKFRPIQLSRKLLRPHPSMRTKNTGEKRGYMLVVADTNIHLTYIWSSPQNRVLIKLLQQLVFGVRTMLIGRIDVYGEEELSVSSSKNRIVLFEKTDMQKRFEKWLTQTENHQDYPKRSLQPSRALSNQGLANESQKNGACLSVSWWKNDGYWSIDMGCQPHFGVVANDLVFMLPKYR